jgi:transposase-like protein
VRLGLFGELGLVQEISCRGGQRPVPILAIIYCKDRNRTEEIARKNPDAGDVWLWVAVDADSKLVLSWRLGQRDLATATDFVNDLAKRVKGRVQITTDALKRIHHAQHALGDCERRQDNDSYTNSQV